MNSHWKIDLNIDWTEFYRQISWEGFRESSQEPRACPHTHVVTFRTPAHNTSTKTRAQASQTTTAHAHTESSYHVGSVAVSCVAFVAWFGRRALTSRLRQHRRTREGTHWRCFETPVDGEVASKCFASQHYTPLTHAARTHNRTHIDRFMNGCIRSYCRLLNPACCSLSIVAFICSILFFSKQKPPNDCMAIAE